MKRIISALLAVILLISMLSITVYADDADDYLRTTVYSNVAAGEVYVTVTALRDTTNGRIAVAYNSKCLRYAGASGTDLLIGENASGGVAIVAYAVTGDTPVSAGEELLTLTFDIKNGIADKLTTVQVTLEDFNQHENIDVQYSGTVVEIGVLNPTVRPDPEPQPDPDPQPTPDVGEDEEEETVKIEDFTDIAPTEWFYEAVEHVVESNYFKGVSEDSFAPQVKMTRAMFVTVLGRVAGIEDGTEASGNKFSDVADGQWFTGFVSWAAEAGIIQGYGDKFDPNGSVTREQMVVMFYRYAQKVGLDLTVDGDAATGYADFTDVSSWAKEAMIWAVDKGIIKGTGKGLDPKADATRAQVAQIVMNFDAFVN